MPMNVLFKCRDVLYWEMHIVYCKVLITMLYTLPVDYGGLTLASSSISSELLWTLLVDESHLH